MVLDFTERCFCKGGAKECEHCKWFFKTIQQKLNDILRSRGYVIVNDLYDLLEWNRDDSGNIYGWDVKDGPIAFEILHNGKFKLHYRLVAKKLNHLFSNN